MAVSRPRRPRLGAPPLEELAVPLRPGRKLLLTGEVLVTYASVRWWLWRHEVRDVVQRLRGWAPPASGGCSRGVEDGRSAYLAGLRLARAVSRTLRLLPTDSRCLMRSLVLTGLLARRGVPSTLIIAARPAPEFTAHAWVEHAGEPLLPPGEASYGRLAEL